MGKNGVKDLSAMQQDLEKPQLLEMFTICGPKKQPHLSVQNITAIKSRFISSSTDVQKLEHLRKTCLVYYNYFLKDMAKCRFFVLLKGDLHCFRLIFIKESHRGAPCRTWRAILGPRRDGGGGNVHYMRVIGGFNGFYMAKWQASKP